MAYVVQKDLLIMFSETKSCLYQQNPLRLCPWLPPEQLKSNGNCLASLLKQNDIAYHVCKLTPLAEILSSKVYLWH